MKMVKRMTSMLPWIGVALLALFLPFTSSPLVARLTGGSMVAPLSLLPMGAMLLFWLLPYLLRRGTLHPQAKIILLFAFVVMISCIFAFTLPIPPFKGNTILKREIESLLTLAVGVGFYLVLSTWLNRSERFYFLLRWVNLSGMLMLAWSFIQAIMWQTTQYYPDWLFKIQGLVSTGQLLFQNRSNGFAYEPSWFAHQLNMLYLPYWLAATVTGFTAHHFKIWKIHFEHILLVGGLVALFLSISRIGWLALLLMIAYLMLYLTWHFIHWTQKILLRRYNPSGQWGWVIRRGFVAFSIIVMLIIYIVFLLGTAYGLSKYDYRMAKLFDYSTIKEYSFAYYANQLVFAERMAFWQSGWDIFNDFPILGVGLGNSGFFFPEKLSAFSWGLTETRIMVYQMTTLPNIKNLWVRLLAETGIIGFAFFISWLYILWKSGRFLLSQQDRLFKTIGLASAFVLVGFIVEGFSIDTFALPYYWISFAFVTAASELARSSYSGKGLSNR
jgi:hypothetical protein